MINSKLLGGILLVVGTSIGAGMLALPMATAQTGFISSSLLLLLCWFVMTASALLILEVSLLLPASSNLISMAKATLGRAGQAVAWVCYLLLLYALLSAYITGGGSFLRDLLVLANIHLSHGVCAVLYAGILGAVIYFGIQSVDYLNRGLMLAKFASYGLLVILALPFVSSSKIVESDFSTMTASVSVVMTSFGFAIIVPSLRDYFHGHIQKLRLVIIIGSLIPLLCYIIWDFAILGVVPHHGATGLIAMAQSADSTGELVTSLTTQLHSGSITLLVRIFTSICLATSFLGVALSLSDFLADGLKSVVQWQSSTLTCLLTILPPLLVAIFYPQAFVMALNYAGIFCIILLILMPALMAWSSRYYKHMPAKFVVPGGKVLLGVLVLFSIGALLQNFLPIG